MHNKIKTSFFTIILSVALVLSFSIANAKMPDLAAASNLRYTTLVNKLYQIQSGPMWFSAPAASSEARHSFLQLLDNVATMGLDKNNYHYTEIAGSAIPTDSIKQEKQNRIFADAVIALCKDVYQGADISSYISNDEISGKYETADNNYLLTLLGLVKSPSELDTLIASLEPKSPEYIALKNEIATQIAANNLQKIKQLNVSLNFYRWIHHFHFDKFIFVNIPTATLRYYEADSMLLLMKVVVGKPATKTPRFSTYCYEVILYPYWNVPRSIVLKELLPKFKKNPAAIDAMNMQVVTPGGTVIDHTRLNWASYNRSNFPYGFRQCTGCDNSLGVIKFNLSDPFSVYLHDTNFKKAFASTNRFLSHGCIRVEKPVELGNYLINNRLDSNFVKACIENQKPVINKIEKPVPVFVVYLPACTDSTNTVTYPKDIYHLFK